MIKQPLEDQSLALYYKVVNSSATDDIKKRILTALGFGNGLPTYVFDLGNNMIKVLMLEYTNAVGEIFKLLLRHGITEITQSEYLARVSEASSKRDSKAHNYMRDGSQYYAMGEAAFLANKNYKPAIREHKYTKKVLGLMAIWSMYMFNQLMYNGEPLPAVCNAYILYPIADEKFKPAVLASVKGKWDVEIGGEKVKTFVTIVDGMPETRGSLYYARLGPTGFVNPTLAKKFEGVGVIFDIGGGTTDIAILKDGDIVKGDSYTKGMNDVARTLEIEVCAWLQKSHSVMVSSLSFQLINEIIMDQNHILHLGGKKYDCTDIFNKVAQSFVNEIRNFALVYTNNYAGIRFVCGTGGGWYALKDFISPISKVANPPMLEGWDVTSIITPGQQQEESIYFNLYGAGGYLGNYKTYQLVEMINSELFTRSGISLK